MVAAVLKYADNILKRPGFLNGLFSVFGFGLCAFVLLFGGGGVVRVKCSGCKLWVSGRIGILGLRALALEGCWGFRYHAPGPGNRSWVLKHRHRKPLNPKP